MHAVDKAAIHVNLFHTCKSITNLRPNQGGARTNYKDMSNAQDRTERWQTGTMTSKWAHTQKFVCLTYTVSSRLIPWDLINVVLHIILMVAFLWIWLLTSARQKGESLGGTGSESSEKPQSPGGRDKLKTPRYTGCFCLCSMWFDMPGRSPVLKQFSHQMNFMSIFIVREKSKTQGTHGIYTIDSTKTVILLNWFFRGMGCVAQWYSTCLVPTRPWVWFPTLKNNKRPWRSQDSDGYEICLYIQSHFFQNAI